jgi:quercetin dioxygenase-like cupin family protein
MQISRNSLDTAKGPAEWFTGDVYIDTIAAPAGTSTFAAANVHFTPGTRTAWHTLFAFVLIASRAARRRRRVAPGRGRLA